MDFLTTLLEGAFRLELLPICGLLSIVYWVYKLGKWILSFLNWFFGFSGTSGRNSGEKLAVSKVEFVRQVVGWCAEHLGMPPKIKRLPTITLRYYRHSKWSGLYFQSKKEIVIYWGNHLDLLSLINTIIHEYQHFLDLRTRKDDQEYAKELKKVGYLANSYEKRARNTASIWERQCYKAMMEKGVIIKS